jgi:uncharacterized membrane protein SpoIIM required for sporulation
MKRNMNRASELIMSSGASFAAALFFFLLGISAGIFTELMMSSAEKEEMISYLDQYFLLSNPSDLAFSDIFMKSAGNNLGLLIIIPAIILAGVAALNVAFYTISNRKFGIKKSIAESSGSYLFVNVILATAILVGCFIESFLSPLLTQLII